ncbi:MAG: ABC transporter substrate-binding protein, partial [Acidimicrobiales bacterium]
GAPHMLRRRTAIAIATLALLVMGACSDDGGGDPVDVGGGTSEGGGGSGEGGTLIAAISGEPDRLDPHLTTAYPSFQVLENVYDTLVQPGDDLTFEPALAEEWETSDDNLTWTFTLREGVTWHNGRDFVADDVVYSYERIMDEETAAANAYRFESIESVTAPDDTTVVIELSRPTPNLLANIGAFKGMAIVPEEIVEDGSIDTEPVGTGPFTFVSQSPDGEIVLERNEDYWQEGLPELDGVTFRPIPDPTVQLTNLQTGEVDWTDGVPPQQVESLSGSDDIVVEAVPGGDYWYMAFNLEREPFGDVDVRRAIAFALDREAITEAAKFEAATVNQTAIPAESFFHYDYAPFEQQVDQAATLLEDAGASDLTMDLMVTNEFPETVTAAQVIADQLSEIGITVEIRELGFSEWLDQQGEGNFDSFLLGWLGNIDPDDFYYAQHRTDASFNFHGYSNPEVDELLDAAREETDEEARKELYDEAVKIIVDEVSYLYLYNPDVVNAWTPAVEGYSTRPDAAIRFVETSLAE